MVGRIISWWVGLVAFVGWLVAQPAPEFGLKVLEMRGRAEARLPDGQWRSLKVDELVPLGSSVRTAPRTTAIFAWSPYKARVKLAPETEVQLSTARLLLLQRGRIWVGTPPPPMGERRFPLPLRCGTVNIVCAPEGFVSVARRPDDTVIVSVDQGSALVFMDAQSITVSQGQMLLVSPQGIFLGPMPLTKQEKLMWDMGGVR